MKYYLYLELNFDAVLYYAGNKDILWTRHLNEAYMFAYKDTAEFAKDFIIKTTFNPDDLKIGEIK